MRVALVANPRSGSGLGRLLADRAAATLLNAGVTADRHDIGPGLPPLAAAAIRGADAVAVAGGDGSVQSVAPISAATGVPLYHLPAGNENLFSREFGMTRDPDRLLWALSRRRVARVDLAGCTWSAPRGRSAAEPTPFLLMASIGPDASVCHRLHQSRKSAVGYRAYVKPILTELAQPQLSHLRITCDGRAVAEGRGMVVVANCRQYAMRIDPCPDALTGDGQLDVVMIPADTAVDALAALLRLRVRCAGHDLVRARGRSVRIEVEGAARLQIDGEAVEMADPAPSRRTFDLSIQPGFLPVLDAR